MKYINRKTVLTIVSEALTGTLLMLIAFGSITHVQAQERQLEILDEISQQQHVCLAMNIYYEARGSSMADQVATADVVLNRVQDTRYPNTICEVVHQGPTKESWKTGDDVPIRNKCQFSWWCDGKADNPQDKDEWVNAQMLAYYIIEEGKFRGLTEGATHYHATYVNPSWASSLSLVSTIGAHIFYRWD
jgi:spore germination cell wall hydrolase CwlJ-like protein|tara:strand:- start:2534 stop:3100 length:567 start_codon:yes stop_codon:yes gene_type:complete